MKIHIFIGLVYVGGSIGCNEVLLHDAFEFAFLLRLLLGSPLGEVKSRFVCAGLENLLYDHFLNLLLQPFFTDIITLLILCTLLFYLCFLLLGNHLLFLSF